MKRRDFLKQTGMAAGLGVAANAAASKRVAIVVPPDDPVSSSPQVKWGAGELRDAIASHRIPVSLAPAIEQTPAGDLCILVAGPHTVSASRSDLALSLPDSSEALLLAPVTRAGRSAILAAGSDERGAVYAALELADRVRHSPDPFAALRLPASVEERPANTVRSIAKYFESDVEDKQWFHDRDGWRAYLSMLAANRYNRFSLNFGLGYNFPRNVRDVYLYFAYPYLLSVPGYQVRVSNLSDAERDRNLETLRFIGDETVARGLQFQLGLWTHAYEWVASPDANAVIEGLNPQNHAAYCRDALFALLQACPSITGVTFRVHGESGIPEGNYAFWETLFQGIVRTNRRIGIDMHAKGMDQKMIDVAQATGMPVTLSPKYWAEHMGLPYHQAAIRELEMPHERKQEGPFTLSAGSRSFLRYGWGDLLTEDRRYGIVHRIWPGTQRMLLWGDPALAAGYGRYSGFCGTQGVELCEPLSFKGRMGSGRPGGRCAYADAALRPKYDWQKYLYTYRVWGRLVYNPETDPDGWRRHLRRYARGVEAPAEAALANASRILLLITTAHGPSASNNAYWPEIYTNMPIVDAGRRHPYRDSPAPQRFGNVSPFDPQLFSTADEFAAELLSGSVSGKYSPVDVADWLERFSAEATRRLNEVDRQSRSGSDPEIRRIAADARIQTGLGRFFALKFRSAVLWALYERTGDAAAFEKALAAYKSARDAWSDIIRTANPVYVADITYGMTPWLRGAWADRTQQIEEDIADMAGGGSKLRPPDAAPVDSARLQAAIRTATGRAAREKPSCRHTPPSRFRPGEPVTVELAFETDGGRSVRLHYRRVNQAERWRSAEMESRDAIYRAIIPGEYSQSKYPLQYYFEIFGKPGTADLYPGFNAELANQPYFVIRQAWFAVYAEGRLTRLTSILLSSKTPSPSVAAISMCSTWQFR